MRIAYVECNAGASGDMFLGAWLDLGIDESKWRTMLANLHVDGYEVITRTVYKNGIRALKVDVSLEDHLPDADGHSHDHNHRHHHDDEHGHNHSGEHHHHSVDETITHHHTHRHLPEIYHILDHSDLPDPVRSKSKDAFRHLAEAEGQIHGMPPEQVHFHEVGAIDAIVDIVGAMAGWYLAGMPECYVSPIEIGGGTVLCDHGIMPVPAPATVALLQGFPVYSSGRWGETVTPTGAAIIRTLCKSEKVPVMIPARIGYGAGTKDFQVANVLRIQLAETTLDEDFVSDGVSQQSDKQVESACVLEANIDDMSPEWGAYAISKLLNLGAMDAWLTPIVMKKGRPALQLNVLCSNTQQDELIRQIQLETTTIGVRYYPVTKSMLPRKIIEVETEFGKIQVKVALQDRNVVNVAPEYEDCRQQAMAHGVPLKAVYHAALTAYYRASQTTIGVSI